MRTEVKGNHDGDEYELGEITVLSKKRVDRIMDGLDVLASRGLLATDEAAELTARIQRLAPVSAELDRVPAPAEWVPPSAHTRSARPA